MQDLFVWYTKRIHIYLVSLQLRSLNAATEALTTEEIEPLDRGELLAASLPARSVRKSSLVPTALAKLEKRNIFSNGAGELFSNTDNMWRCGRCNHTWLAPLKRLLGRQQSGCPFCAPNGDLLCKDEEGCCHCRSRTVAYVDEELRDRGIAFFAFMNAPLRASRVLRGSGKPVWWDCLACNA